MGCKEDYTACLYEWSNSTALTMWDVKKNTSKKKEEKSKYCLNYVGCKEKNTDCLYEWSNSTALTMWDVKA